MEKSMHSKVNVAETEGASLLYVGVTMISGEIYEVVWPRAGH